MILIENCVNQANTMECFRNSLRAKQVIFNPFHPTGAFLAPK